MSYTFAIGDIHGCREELERLLDRISMARPDGGTVVFLGDYIDRGPDSKGVIDIIKAGPKSDKWKWIALKGNHEDMMVAACDGTGDVSMWIVNGGAQTLASFGGGIPSEYEKWAADLPTSHQDKHRVYAHAGMDGSVPFDDQNEAILLWHRYSPGWSGSYWGKHLVHGHTPDIKNPTTIGNRTNLDSACVFGGKLSCAVFDDDVQGEPLEFMCVSRTKSAAA